LLKTKKVEVPDYVLEHEDRPTKVKIFRQQNPVDPMSKPSPVTLELSHGRYDLGDKDANTGRNESWEAVEQEIREEHQVIAMKKVYLLDHSGLRIKTSPFNNAWDSGMVGYAYVTEESLPDYSDTQHDRPDRDKIQTWIDDRIKQYDQYLSGEVYRYEVIEDGESVDTCGGFYGDPRKNEILWDYVGYPREKFEVTGGELS
jgi:hypothetical protein